MKKFLSLLIIAAVAFTFAGCGDDDSGYAPKSVSGKTLYLDSRFSSIYFSSNSSCSVELTYNYSTLFEVTGAPSCSYSKTDYYTATLWMSVPYYYDPGLSGISPSYGTWEYQLTLNFTSPTGGYATGTHDDNYISYMGFTIY